MLDRSKNKKTAFSKPAFAIDIAHPPAVTEDRALIRLVPETSEHDPSRRLRCDARRVALSRVALRHAPR